MEPPPLVQVVEVSKIYRRAGNGLAALSRIDLAVPRGEFLAIMGPSGSGKSTLLNLMGFLDRPTGGKILLEGEDVGALDDRAASRVRNRRVGFLFQSFNLIPQMSIIDNVETPLLYSDRPEGEWRPRALDLLSRLGLRERAHHRPAELSGGEAQRAALARALINDPDLLLADEPTGNLDSTTGGHVLALLSELIARGKTLVLVTHDREIARRAHRVVELRDGRLVREERASPPRDRRSS